MKCISLSLICILLSFASTSWGWSGALSQNENCEDGTPSNSLLHNSSDILTSIAPVVSCHLESMLHDAGYRLSANKMRILGSNQRTDLTADLNDAEIKRRIAARIDQIAPGASGVSSDTLALKIVNAANAFGLDPFILAAMYEQENKYENRQIGNNGVGIGQMTTTATKELKHQYGFARGQFTEGVPDIMKQMAASYYGNNKDGYDSFIEWVRSPSRNALASSLDKSIVASASLLKLYLALQGGSYAKALTQYNSVYDSYDNNVRRKAQNINFVCATEEDQRNSAQIQSLACSISNSDSCTTTPPPQDANLPKTWDI